MRVLVCGGRDFADRQWLHEVLAQYEITLLISGHAPYGADSLAEGYARRHKIKTLIFQAQWKKYGRGAGPLRNQRMLDEGKPDLVIAFPGGRGTFDMIMKARCAGVPVVEAVAGGIPEV